MHEVHTQSTSSNSQDAANNAKNQLEVGDELISVNGASFASMPLEKAYAACAASTHLALVVKANPYAYRQVTAISQHVLRL